MMSMPVVNAQLRVHGHAIERKMIKMLLTQGIEEMHQMQGAPENTAAPLPISAPIADVDRVGV